MEGGHGNLDNAIAVLQKCTDWIFLHGSSNAHSVSKTFARIRQLMVAGFVVSPIVMIAITTMHLACEMPAWRTILICCADFVTTCRRQAIVNIVVKIA